MPNPQIPSIQEYLKRLLAAKTTPDMLLPAALNLEWGMSKEACSALTDKPVIKEEHDFTPGLFLEKDDYLLKLNLGGDYDTLNTIYSGAYQTYRDSDFTHYSQEQKHSYRQTNYELFLQLQQFYSQTLGLPDSTKNDLDEEQFAADSIGCEAIWEYNNSLLWLSYQDYLVSYVAVRLIWKPKKPIWHFDLIDQAKIVPTDLTAAKLGIDWNFSKEEALAQINGEVLPQVEYNNSIAFVLVEIRGQTYKVQLYFDETNSQLLRISTDLYISRSFWEGDWTYEEVGEIARQVKLHYHQYLERCKASLGNPLYFNEGFSLENDYENHERLRWWGTAIAIAVWNTNDTDIQVEFDKEDKEIPFYISIKSYPPVPDTPE